MNVQSQISIVDARLPAAYEAAKVALANCASIDECQQWADKAEALASYAKQADDDTLRKQADRIQARAIRRCGELLKQFDGRGGNRSKTDGTVTFAPTRTEVAREAGISERRQVTAVRVANVPADTFERAVESDTPPTVTKLADIGRRSAPKPVIDLQGRDPGQFNRALHFIAEIKDYADALARANLGQILPGLIESEASQVRRLIGSIDSMHDHIITRI